MRGILATFGLSAFIFASSAFSQNAALQWVAADASDLVKIKGMWGSSCYELNDPSFSAKSMATVYAVKDTVDPFDNSVVTTIEQQDVFFVDSTCSEGDANLYGIYASLYTGVTPTDKASFTQDDLNYLLLVSDMTLSMEQVYAATPEAKTEFGKIFQTDLSSGSASWTYGPDAVVTSVVGLVEGKDGAALLLFEVGADGSLNPYAELYKFELPAATP